MNTGLYIHIPYCRQKCNYCGFLSFLCAGNVPSAYLALLGREMALYQKYEPLIDTVFIGGGTPSLLKPEDLVRLLQDVQNNFSLAPGAEITMEGNPESLTGEVLQGAKAAGVNRISMGLQAAQDALLQSLGRVHSYEQFEGSFRAARKAGFDNINVDVMFGVPGQTPQQLADTLQKIYSLGDPKSENSKMSLLRPAEHISLYTVQLEEGTTLYEAYRHGRVDLPPYEADRAMYYAAIDFLKDKGYGHYEISNFAQEEGPDGFGSAVSPRKNTGVVSSRGFCGAVSNERLHDRVANPNIGAGKTADGYRVTDYRCRHNVGYWSMKPYIGLGLGASSFLEGRRYKNTDRQVAYANALNVGYLPLDKPISHLQELPKEDKGEEQAIYCFTALRKREGIHFAAFEEYFGQSFEEVYGPLTDDLNRYAAQNQLIVDADGIRLTTEGIGISNDIMALFVMNKPPQITARSKI